MFLSQKPFPTVVYIARVNFCYCRNLSARGVDTVVGKSSRRSSVCRACTRAFFDFFFVTHYSPAVYTCSTRLFFLSCQKPSPPVVYILEQFTPLSNPCTPRTDDDLYDLCDLFPLHDLDISGNVYIFLIWMICMICMIYLMLPGLEPYHMHDPAHVSCMGSVLHRSCTASYHNGRLRYR